MTWWKRQLVIRGWFPARPLTCSSYPLFQSRVYLGMTTLKELIVKRPSRQFQYLHVLLDLSSHEKEKVGPHILTHCSANLCVCVCRYHIFRCFLLYFQVRTTALGFLKRMYEKDQLRDYIEKFALNYMQLLVHPNPPSLLFGADKDTGSYLWMIFFFHSSLHLYFQHFTSKYSAS